MTASSGGGVVAMERAELEEERSFLLGSIEDLDAEFDAGDLAEADYRSLRDRYTVRAAAVLRALEGVEDPGARPLAPAPPPATKRKAVAPWRPGRRRRRALLWAAGGLFAAAAVVLVVAEVTSRLPGQTASGTVTLSPARQLERTLAQAKALEAQGKGAQALVLYHQVLANHPDQEQALAETGWLEYQAGVAASDSRLLSAGQSTEQRAEQVDPAAFAPHLYLGSMLLVEGRDATAAAEFSVFLALHPPVAVEQQAWPFIVRADTGAGVPLPALPAGVHG